MFTLFKAGLLVMYALALAGLAGLLPNGLASTLQNIVIVTLIIHVIEAVVMFKAVRLYRGPLAISVLLTLLFGLLHWKPLADAQAKP
ncbi:MAG: hypothetical protein RL302_1188 [Pseudomonadota bacterium]|jgi:uncharacterized protein YhhL (DUF1145 family)